MRKFIIGLVVLAAAIGVASLAAPPRPSSWFPCATVLACYRCTGSYAQCKDCAQAKGERRQDDCLDVMCSHGPCTSEQIQGCITEGIRTYVAEIQLCELEW